MNARVRSQRYCLMKISRIHTYTQTTFRKESLCPNTEKGLKLTITRQHSVLILRSIKTYNYGTAQCNRTKVHRAQSRGDVASLEASNFALKVVHGHRDPSTEDRPFLDSSWEEKYAHARQSFSNGRRRSRANPDPLRGYARRQIGL